MTPARNYWPYGILLTFALFIPATAGLIVMASLHREELVSRDYYEQELRYSREMESAARALPAQFRVSVRFESAGRFLRIVWPGTRAPHAVRGRVQFYRPSEARLDRSIALQLDPQGGQTIDAQSLQPGLWKVRLRWTDQGLEYSQEQSVIIPHD